MLAPGWATVTHRRVTVAQPPRLPPDTDAGRLPPSRSVCERTCSGRGAGPVRALPGALGRGGRAGRQSAGDAHAAPRPRRLQRGRAGRQPVHRPRPARSSSSRRAPDGRENVLAVMGPSDQFGELSVFDPGPRTATATAVTDVKLARMPQSTLRLWIEAHPEIGEQLLRVLARRLRRTNDSRRRPDLHRRPRPRGQGAAADGRPLRQPRERRPARQARPDAGGAGPAGRRLPRDGEQGAGRLRAPRLDPAAGQVGRRPRRGPPRRRAR